VADKLYAQNIDIQEKHPTTLAIATGEKHISGYGKDISVMMNKMGIQGERPSDEEWVHLRVNGYKAFADKNKINHNQVPDVRGMGLKDAVYLLENQGLRVRIIGRGLVKTQSVPAGMPAQKNMEVVLELA
jgi:cell division protein FtsI (penicillin-binding protein 3)